MKKIIKKLYICMFLFIFICLLTGCSLLENVGGNNNSSDVEYETEFTYASGKWELLNDEGTYFEFDGNKNVMTFSYHENGNEKYNGSFRVVHRGLGKDVKTPLTFIFVRKDKQKEDWIGCYAEDVETNFTQFTIMTEEEDLGMISGSIYTHIYRISELPYKMGTYVLDNKQYQQDSNDYKYAKEKHIASGTYVNDSGESFMFLTIKPAARELFQYKNGDIIIEGTYTMASDEKTIYLYIENDPFSKVTPEDKDDYDTTFNLNYPPDFYLRGDFSNENNIIINGLYHHTYSPTTIKDSDWVFGTYTK